MYSTLHAILIIEHYLFTTGESFVRIMAADFVSISNTCYCHSLVLVEIFGSSTDDVEETMTVDGKLE